MNELILLLLLADWEGYIETIRRDLEKSMFEILIFKCYYWYI